MKITLIKFGGSLITDKATPYTARLEVIERLARELMEMIAADPAVRIVIGHGSGSFGHQAALEHGIETREGALAVREAAARLNEIVMNKLVDAGLPVVRCAPHAFWADGFREVVQVLESEKIPVIYGDVIEVSEGVFKIFSTERLFDAFIKSMPGHNVEVDRVIMVGETEGVLDSKGQVIERITRENWPSIREMIGDPRGHDVTGGMVHKIESALEWADRGVETMVMNHISSPLPSLVGGTHIIPLADVDPS